ncbi:ribonuclease HI family protein [Candidatus Bathyarchaeota archaeon]|nr:ribonuclease HI family protein [Candidatus Bathyarchaeota archaeon]
MIEVFVDGLCEPVNPRGVATFGFVVYKDDAKIKLGSGVVDSSNSSNNAAEYSALIQVLKFLVDNGFTEERVVVKSDSQLLVFQLNSYYSVEAYRIIPLFRQASDLLKHFRKIKMKWIPREENVEADALSRKAYADYWKKHPRLLKNYSKYLATEKQKNFMKKLKIQFPFYVSKREASRLIGKKLEELKRR